MSAPSLHIAAPSTVLFDINVSSNTVTGVSTTSGIGTVPMNAGTSLIANISTVLTASDIESLDNRTCIICLDECIDEAVSLVNCNSHVFHSKCIEECFQHSHKCPVCGYVYRLDIIIFMICIYVCIYYLLDKSWITYVVTDDNLIRAYTQYLFNLIYMLVNGNQS